jgi:hypothetical protein
MRGVCLLRRVAQIVGGLCWSITASGEDVDINLFYDDELNLGQKM